MPEYGHRGHVEVCSASPQSLKAFQEGRPSRGAQLRAPSPHCRSYHHIICCRSRDPWDCPASILCNEIRIIIRHTGRVDFEVDPKGAIYKNVSTGPSKLYPCSCNSSIGELMTDWQLVISYWFGFSCTYHNVYIRESEHVIPYAEEGHKVG